MHRAHSFLALIFIVALTGLVAAGTAGATAQAQPSLLTAAATVAIAQSQPAGGQPSGSSSSSTSSSSQTSGEKAPAAESGTSRTETTRVSGSPLLWLGIGGAVLLVLIIVLAASRGKDGKDVTVVK
jgi:hypothetical protein